MIIQQRNQFLHVIQKMKAIFILLVKQKKLSPQRFINIMELNDIPLKIRRCSDCEATIFSDYTLLFQTADEAIFTTS